MTHKIKAITSTVLAVAILTTSTLATPYQKNTQVEQTAKLLDISNISEDNLITRGEFAEMLVSVSPHRNAVDNFGYTLFSDVNANHKSAPEIKISLEYGYMSGDLDGMFRPDEAITYEETVAATLNLLGYKNITGNYPYSHIAKFEELGLNENIAISTGQTMTKDGCLNLLYNALNTKTQSGVIYAQSLGFPINARGEIDTSKLAQSYTKGPYTISNSHKLPFETDANTIFYKNDKIATSTDIQSYDICYYNDELNTVWAYNKKISGRITAINTPISPATVTVAGTNYALESQNAIYDLSSSGSFSVGDIVTLLLGSTGKVAEVLPINEVGGTEYGVVVKAGTVEYGTSANSSELQNSVTVALTDGSTRTYDTGNKDYTTGDVLSITYPQGMQTIERVNSKEIDGKVSKGTTSLGKYPLADDIQILEVSDTRYKTIVPSHLDGYTLNSSDILFFEKNAQGEINHMILEEVTGDLEVYGLITDVNEIDFSSGNVGTLMGQYQYISNGVPGFEVTQNKVYNVDFGGHIFKYENGKIDSMRALQKGKITNIDSFEAVISKDIFEISDNIQVYEQINGQYITTSLDVVSDLESYTLTGYYDDFYYSAGNKVRIITATKK